MVNNREKQVLEQYEKEGWETIRCGAPDFLFVKVENREIKDFVFVEVKSKKSELTYPQEIWKQILEKIGAIYKVEVI